MKLKLFIVPSLVVALIVFIIWFLVPDALKLREDLGKLQATDAKLVDIQEKNNGAEKLKNELQAIAEKKNVLLEFLPTTKQEENIIGDLDRITFGEGVALSNVTVEKASEASTPAEVTALPAEGAVDSMGLMAPAPVAAETSKDVKVSFKIFGGYEQIMRVLNKLVTLKRYNELVEVKISKAPAAAAVLDPETGLPVGGGTSANSLIGEVKANFKYLGKIKSIADINNNILKVGKFDTAIIDEINALKTTSLTILDPKEPGRTNPFIP